MDPSTFLDLSLREVATFALFLAALDTSTSIAIALSTGNFSPAHVLDFLRAHVLKFVFPILALSALGHGIPGWLPAIPESNTAAGAALVGYLVLVLASIKGSWTDKAAVPT